MTRTTIVIIALLVLGSRPAQAEESRSPVSVTISPVHLIFPVVEVTAEVGIASQLGAGLMLGVGKTDDFNLIEGGAQLNYYVLYRGLKGLHVGGEVQYLHAFGESMGTTAEGTGLAVGAYLGWKWILASGLTFVAQAGAQSFVVDARAESDSNSAMTNESDVGALLNLNVGWTF